MILAIDPGNIESAYVVINERLQPIKFGKVKNEELLTILNKIYPDTRTHLVIEKIASYGMAVGQEVFDTCIWIGRFWEAYEGEQKHYIYRKEEKINLCGSMKAKDANIRQALIDRFGVVGIKSKPGWFYGFKSDIWSAYAVAVTFADKHLQEVDG